MLTDFVFVIIYTESSMFRMLYPQSTPASNRLLTENIVAARLNVVNGNYRVESGSYPANYIMLC